VLPVKGGKGRGVVGWVKTEAGGEKVDWKKNWHRRTDAGRGDAGVCFYGAIFGKGDPSSSVVGDGKTRGPDERGNVLRGGVRGQASYRLHSGA